MGRKKGHPVELLRLWNFFTSPRNPSFALSSEQGSPAKFMIYGQQKFPALRRSSKEDKTVGQIREAEIHGPLGHENRNLSLSKISPPTKIWVPTLQNLTQHTQYLPKSLNFSRRTGNFFTSPRNPSTKVMIYGQQKFPALRRSSKEDKTLGQIKKKKSTALHENRNLS